MEKKEPLPIILQIIRPLRKFLINHHKYEVEAFQKMITLKTYAFFLKKKNIEAETLFYLMQNYYVYDGFKLMKKTERKMLFEKKDIKFRIKMEPYIEVDSNEIGPFGFGNNYVEYQNKGFFTVIKIFD